MLAPRPTPLRRLALWWHDLSPATLLLLSFALLILVGTAGLLLLPGLYVGEPLGLLDALFMITSAVCVTGLAVVDTATRFTFAGQLWILVFIQLGGLGLVTLTTLVIGALGRQLSLRSEILAAPGSEVGHAGDPLGLVLQVTKAVFVIEGAGALVLWGLWAPRYGPLEGLWHAVFHSISAFCNAGFSTFSDSVIGFAKSPSSLLVLSALIVVGGIGYVSGEEALRWWRSRGPPRRRRLSSHTWAVLVVTAALLVAGTVLFCLFEWDGVLASFSPLDRLVNGFFMSVTARTAGFNNVDYGQITNSSAYLTILLMVVGGSPGSTAGGIKTTALAILVARAWTRMRGRRHVEIHQRTVPPGTVDRTVSLALLAFGFMTAAVFLLSYTEVRGLPIDEARRAFLPLFFEVVSAFCTVGLSMGKTADLSAAGKLAVIVLMFVGRVGLLSFFAALTLRGRSSLREMRSAQADLVVG